MDLIPPSSNLSEMLAHKGGDKIYGYVPETKHNVLKTLLYSCLNQKFQEVLMYYTNCMHR